MHFQLHSPFTVRFGRLLPSQGFRPEGEIPSRHSTVEIYSQYARKNLDLLEQGPRGIGR